MQNRLAQLCLLVIGIPFIYMWWSGDFRGQTLPIQYADPCIFQIQLLGSNIVDSDEGFEIVTTWVVGVGYYDPVKKYGVTAYHVIDNCGTTTINQSNLFLWSSTTKVSSEHCFVEQHPLSDIKRIGTSDVAIFDMKQYQCLTGVIIPNSWTYLMTYQNSIMEKVPVTISGTYINYNPDYGQSGSPIFREWKMIGVVSQKVWNEWLIELLSD